MSEVSKKWARRLDVEKERKLTGQEKVNYKCQTIMLSRDLVINTNFLH